MDYRKFAIRVLYASITIAVIAGVMTLFAPGAWDVIGRLLGTAITTALAAAMLLIAIKMLETPTTRPVGVTLGLLVCCVYVSLVCSFWLGLIRQPPIFSTLEQKFGETAMFSTMFGIPMLVGAVCMAQPRGKLAGTSFLGIWLVVLLSWLVDTWISAPFINFPIEYFTVPLIIFSPIALLVLIARGARVRQVGIVLAASGCIATQIGAMTTGGNMEDSPFLLQAALFLGWVSAELGFWNLITFRDNKFALPWIERLAAVLCGIALASLCLVIWSAINNVQLDELLGRVSVSSGILASASVLAIVVSQLIHSVVIVKFDGSELTAVCPRCKKDITVPQGKSTCPYCTLQIKMRIESIGCRKCGYDLTGSIESNCCPECGELIILPGASN